MTRPDRFSAAFQSASGAAILAALISSMFVGLTGQVIFAVIGCAVGYAAYKRRLHQGIDSARVRYR